MRTKTPNDPTIGAAIFLAITALAALVLTVGAVYFGIVVLDIILS